MISEVPVARRDIFSTGAANSCTTSWHYDGEACRVLIEPGHDAYATAAPRDGLRAPENTTE